MAASPVAAGNASRLVDMEDIDAPEVAPAPRTFPAPPPAKQLQDHSRLSNVPLEDVVESLSRSPSSSDSAPAAAAEGNRALPRRRRAARSGFARDSSDVDDASSSIPTEKDLYGGTRRRGHRRPHRHSKRNGGDEERASGRSATKRTTVDAEVAQTTPAVEDDDALLRKMRRKEKEFDSKIKEINNTFFSAGRQLVVRDDIIERLQAELANMRSQAHHRTRAEEQRYHEKEKELVDQCNATVSRIRQENEALRAALEDGTARQTQQQKVMDQLMQQLTDADAKTRELKRQQEHKLDSIRTTCQDQLREFDRKVSAMQRRCAELEADRDGLQRTHAQSQAKLLGLQMELNREKEGDSKALKELWKERESLQEEVEAVRLSMARLLQVMAQVPDLKDYLQWNEVDSNFVFLGFPTRYFSLEGGHHGTGYDDAANPESEGKRAKGKRYDNDLSAMGSARQGTGVEDGIYTGAASFQDSKNVWLNGHWVRQLQEIIHAENMYLRLKKIKLYELEEAGQVSDNLPNARDVLQCRRQEKDYWVPYAIFQEAQSFKNRYYPKIPALSHFYPFLVRLNAIWYGKLQDRVRTLKKDLQVAQQQVVTLKRGGQQGGGGGGGGRSHQLSCSRYGSPYESPSSASLEARRGRANMSARVFLLGLGRTIAEWESQFEHLRRQVRLTVTSQRSLQLFRTYSGLLRSCLSTVKDLAVRCQELEEESAFAADVSATAHHTEEFHSAGYRGGGRARHSRSSSFDSASDGNESSEYDDDDDAVVRPLPPPPMRGHSRRRQQQSRKSPRHREQQQEQEVSNLAAWRSGTDDAGSAEQAVESLLCLVQHSCERVCGVGDDLAERTQACCNDLESLMTMLRDVYLPSITTTTAAPSSSVSTSSSTATSSASLQHRAKHTNADSAAAAAASTESSMLAVQKQIRDILRDQYGPPGLAAAAAHTPNGEVGEAAAAPAYLRAMRGMERGRRANGAGPESALPHIVASVLDFSRAIRGEVAQAQKALQVIATEAMKEAEDC